MRQMNNSGKETIRFINTNEPVTTLYRDLLPMLSDAGYRSEILMAKAEYRGDRKLEEFLSSYENIRIRKTFSGFFKNYTGLLAKGSVHVFYAAHALVIMLFSKKVNLQVFLTQPPFFFIAGLVVKKIRKIPYVVVVMDLQPDEYIEFGYFNADRFYVRWLNYWCTAALRNADSVIVIGRCMVDSVLAKGVDEKNIVFVPNWTTDIPGLNTEIRRNQFRSDMGWQDKFVVLYGGNVGNAQLFDDLIAVAEELHALDDLVICIVGGGIRFSELQNQKTARQIGNLHLLTFQHQKYDVPTIYGAGDVNFVSLRHNCTGHGVPSKAYVSLAAGRPIIFEGSRDCEIARLVTEEGIGFAVSDKESLKSKIVELYNRRDRAVQMGIRAKELSLTKYSANTSSLKYKAVIDECVAVV